MQPHHDTFIAPGSYQRSTGPNKKMMLIIGGLAFAVLAAALLLLSTGGDSAARLTERLVIRLESTLAIADDGSENITDTSLRHLNAEIRATLLADITTLAETAAIPDKADEAIAAEESEAGALEELADAKIESNYDVTYRKIIDQRLQSSAALATEIYEESSDAELRAALEQHFSHLSTLRDRLAEERR